MTAVAPVAAVLSEAAFEDVAVVVPVVPVFEEVVAAVLLAFESVLLSDLLSAVESVLLSVPLDVSSPP